MITCPAISPGLQRGATPEFLSDASASLTSIVLLALVEDVSVLWSLAWDMIIWWVSQTHIIYLIQHVCFSEPLIPSTICHSNPDISASLSVGLHFFSRLPGADLAASLLHPLGSLHVKDCIPRECPQIQKPSFILCYGPVSLTEHPHNPVPWILSSPVPCQDMLVGPATPLECGPFPPSSGPTCPWLGSAATWP